jgi:outer membrane protein TolC
LGAVAPAWAADPAAELAPLGLSALLERAEAQNPDLEAARLRWEAAKAKTGYAGALDAPRVQASLMDVLTLGGPSVAVTQMIPGGSKRALMTEAANREAAVAEAEFAQQRLAVVRDLRQAYTEHVYLNRAQAIYQQTLAQVRNLRKIADAKYAVGSGLQQEPIRAQRELSMLLEKGLKLDAELEASRAWINTLANRPAKAAVQVPKDLPTLPPMPKIEALLAAADAHNPALRAVQAQVKAQEAALKLSQQEKGTPDFEVGVEAGRSMPGDMTYIGGMVGFNLPWLSAGRYEARIREAATGLEAANAMVQAERNRLRGEIHRVLAELSRQERQVQLYKQGILPQSTQALKAALAAYQVNKVDFDTVLESQTAVYQAQTDEARAKADYHQTLAKLEALVGATIGAPSAK